MLVDCKGTTFTAAGWCTEKYLSLNPTIKNLVVILLGVTGLKETGLVCFLNLFREGSQWVMGFVVCGVLLDYCANGGWPDVLHCF